MMRIHLLSIRQFYPSAPILVSKKGGESEEMEAHRVELGISYWLEDCNYVAALLRLLQRCETEYVCILDHDALLLSSLDRLLCGLRENEYDLVGVEERIRYPKRDAWLRFAPGYMDATILLFNLRSFLSQWGLRGVKWKRTEGTRHREYHYGICQKLKRHKYLLPFHSHKYGLGNVLKDGDVTVAWHQWFGCYRRRALENPDIGAPVPELEEAERLLLTDYPNLDLSELRAAWGSECDIGAEQVAAAKDDPCTGLRGFTARVRSRLNRVLKDG